MKRCPNCSKMVQDKEEFCNYCGEDMSLELDDKVKAPKTASDSLRDTKKYDENVQALYNHAAELIKKGLSAKQVENKLVEDGLSQEVASTVVKKLFALRSKVIKDAAKRNMMIGAFWCIGGLIVTIGSYSAVSGGGRYVVAWGAMLFGGIQFLGGLFQYLSR